jgi:hypothetical protein
MKNKETSLSLINRNEHKNKTVIAAFFACLLAAAFGLAFAFFPPELMGGEPEPETQIDAEAAAPQTAESGGNVAVKAPKKSGKGSRGDGDGIDDASSGGGTQSRINLDMNSLSLYIGQNDWNFIGVMTLRFILNIFFAYILITRIYTQGNNRIKEFSFSFFVSNILIFMVTSLLASVKVRTGFAFGLFAILSILRYRTEQIQIREMTFLFASIILGVLNSLATADITIFAVLWANVILCMFVYLCDRVFIGETEQILLVYDNTKLLGKDKRQELHDDIKARFGYDVVKVVIVEMNYLTDSAKVKLVYRRK